MIATLSQGNDEIFGKTYVPPPGQRRQNAANNFTYVNSDGLLSNIPKHLLSKKGERSLKLSLLAPEQRAQLKLMQADERIERVHAAKTKLQKAIEKEQLKQQQRQAGADTEMVDMKAEIQKQLQQQADEYVAQQLVQREQQLQQQFHDAWEQRLKADLSEDQLTRFQYSSAKKLVFSPAPNTISNKSDIEETF